jgi:hypothetical protein
MHRSSGPVIPLLDGYGSDVNREEALLFGDSINIHLLSLSPNTTHVSQPVNRSFLKSLNSAFNQVYPLFPSFDAFHLLLPCSPHNLITEFPIQVGCTYVPEHLGPMTILPGVTQGDMRSCGSGLYVLT